MKQRLHYFDILKGMAIFLVVMGHVLGMCVRGIDRAPLFKLIGEIHMPLFFFISGWFTMKWSEGSAVKIPALLPRAKRLLLPMIVVSSIWIWYYPLSGLSSPFTSTFDGLWSAPWKNGYWFTLVLFEITALYCVTAPLLGRKASLGRETAATAGVFALMLTVNALVPEHISDYASYSITVTFYPVFMIGAIARRHAEGFGRLCADSRVFTVAFIVSVIAIFYLGWPWNFPVQGFYYTMAARILLHLSLPVMGIALVKPWSERAFASGKGSAMARMWEYIGVHSLAIYLLHYFFLFPLGDIRPGLEAMNLNIVPLTVLTVVCSAAIVGLVLLIDFVLNHSKLLGLLLTGSEAPKQKVVK